MQKHTTRSDHERENGKTISGVFTGSIIVRGNGPHSYSKVAFSAGLLGQLQRVVPAHAESQLRRHPGRLAHHPTKAVRNRTLIWSKRCRFVSRWKLRPGRLPRFKRRDPDIAGPLKRDVANGHNCPDWSNTSDCQTSWPRGQRDSQLRQAS
jgi:hypothetical protein